MSETHILIIGGGANGVAAFIQLVSELIIRQLHQNVSFTIVEKNDVIGEGLAFGTKQPGHLLNTQSRLMGIHPFEPCHYSDWLETHKSLVPEQELKQYEDPEDSYTTRRLYSVYLQQCFAEYLDLAKRHRIQVDCVNAEATNIHVRPNGYRVEIDGSEPLDCSIVILAPGTPKPRMYEEFEPIDTYVDFPWPSKNLLKIPTDATVGVLGTSLSAIDAVMTLVDNNHSGKILLVSPDGLLPRVQPRKESDYECKYLTAEAIHAIRRNALRSPTAVELFRLFQKEVHHYYGHTLSWKELERNGRDARSLLEADIASAESGGDGLINVLYATREISAAVWNWLSVEEQQRFRKWLGIDWQITRHAMPIHNARRLKRLFDNDQLIVCGGLEDVKYNGSKFVMNCGNDIMETDYAVNATGPGGLVSEMKSKLIENIHASGIIEAYPLGGIKINPQTMQVVSSPHDTNCLYAVGHLTNGMLIDSNAVWFNIRMVATMVTDVVSRLEGGKDNTTSVKEAP